MGETNRALSSISLQSNVVYVLITEVISLAQNELLGHIPDHFKSMPNLSKLL